MVAAIGAALAASAFTQAKAPELLAPIQVAAPMYPSIAIHARLEQRITATIEMDSSGKIIDSEFDSGAKVFHNVIKQALQRTTFATSGERRRNASLVYAFTLLPSDSKGYITSVFTAPNTVTVYAKQVVVIDANDRKKGSKGRPRRST